MICAFVNGNIQMWDEIGFEVEPMSRRGRLLTLAVALIVIPVMFIAAYLIAGFFGLVVVFILILIAGGVYWCVLFEKHAR